MSGLSNAANPKITATPPRMARAHQCPVSDGNACGVVMPSSFSRPPNPHGAPIYMYQTHYMHARRIRDMPQLNELTAPTSPTKSRKRGEAEALPTSEGRSVLLHAHRVAAGALGPVECRVCRVGQLLAVPLVFWATRYAYGVGGPGRRAFEREGALRPCAGSPWQPPRPPVWERRAGYSGIRRRRNGLRCGPPLRAGSRRCVRSHPPRTLPAGARGRRTPL